MPVMRTRGAWEVAVDMSLGRGVVVLVALEAIKVRVRESSMLEEKVKIGGTSRGKCKGGNT